MRGADDKAPTTERWARLSRRLSTRLLVLLVSSMALIFGVLGYLNIQLHRRHLERTALADAARMSSVISTGTSVTPRNAAKNIANVFVKASGRKSRPSCAVSEKTGTKLTVITSSAKKSARPTPLAPAMIT